MSWHWLLKALFVPYLLLTMGGCSSVVVITDQDPDADFTGLKTYAWAPAPGREDQSRDPRVYNDLFEKRVHAAVDRELAAKGYPLTTTAEADFWVAYHAALESKVQVTNLYTTYPYMPSYPVWESNRNAIVSQYEQGSLMLDVIDPKTKKLIWRGTGEAIVEETDSTEKREKRINEAVAEILERFPPS